MGERAQQAAQQRSTEPQPANQPDTQLQEGVLPSSPVGIEGENPFGEPARVLPELDQLLVAHADNGPQEEVRHAVQLTDAEREALKRQGIEPAVIDVYGQHHSHPAQTIHERLRVGEYQALILARLEQEKPQHVFVEGRTDDLEPDTDFRQRMRRAHPGILIDPADPTDQDRLLLAEEGAAYLYAMRHPSVTLHRTTTEAAETKVEENLDRLERAGKFGTPEYQYWVQEFREKAAISEIRSLLAAHPELEKAREGGPTSVALIYGQLHNDNWGRDRFPDPKQPNPVEVHDWPLEYDPVKTTRQIALQRDSERQLGLVQEVAKIDGATIQDTGYFYLQSAEAQIAALPLLEVDPQDWPSDLEFKNALLAYAEKSLPADQAATVRDAIEARWEKRNQDRTPPFGIFQPEKRGEIVFFAADRIAEVSVLDQSDFVRDQTDIATQDAMVRQATGLTVFTYSDITSLRGKREALPKLQINPEQWKSAEELRQYLLSEVPPADQSMLRSMTRPTPHGTQRFQDLRELHRSIDDLYQREAGPFTGLPCEKP